MTKPIRAPHLLLAATLALSVVGCSSAPASAGKNGNGGGRVVSDGASFAMQPGDRVTLSNASSLRYVNLKSDSRCPPGVQCIHAGNAVLAFESRPATGGLQSLELNLPDQPQSRDLGSLRVTLQSLAFGDAPQAQLKVERSN